MKVRKRKGKFAAHSLSDSGGTEDILLYSESGDLTHLGRFSEFGQIF